MSRRTFEASKAIAAAWQNEQQLVQAGKGTRDWTPEQQRDILEKGKAYDDNGKAFEGHHMKSAEKYPECQGEAENIQFLSRTEHFAAHGGSFLNPTNGYFNRFTGETRDFGADKYKACDVTQLTNPVILIERSNIPEFVEPKCENSIRPSADDIDNRDRKTIMIMEVTDSVPIGPKSKSIKMSRFAGFAKKAGKFLVENKEAIIGLTITIGTLIKTFSKSSDSVRSGDEYGEIREGDNRNHVSDEELYEVSEKSSHASPCEHIVPAHRQRYNGRWKEKAPYLRGKKKENDEESMLED